MQVCALMPGKRGVVWMGSKGDSHIVCNTALIALDVPSRACHRLQHLYGHLHQDDLIRHLTDCFERCGLGASVRDRPYECIALLWNPNTGSSFAVSKASPMSKACRAQALKYNRQHQAPVLALHSSDCQ